MLIHKQPLPSNSGTFGFHGNLAAQWAPLLYHLSVEAEKNGLYTYYGYVLHSRNTQKKKVASIHLVLLPWIIPSVGSKNFIVILIILNCECWAHGGSRNMLKHTFQPKAILMILPQALRDSWKCTVNLISLTVIWKPVRQRAVAFKSCQLWWSAQHANGSTPIDHYRSNNCNSRAGGWPSSFFQAVFPEHSFWCSTVFKSLGKKTEVKHRKTHLPPLDVPLPADCHRA